MPFYTFMCETCNSEKTELREMGNFEEPLCDTCDKVKMKKMMGAPGFQLKGGGWYKDGYSKPQLSVTSGGKQVKSYSSKDEAVDAAGRANETKSNRKSK